MAFEILRESNSKETHTRNNIHEMQSKALLDTEKRIQRLVDMKLGDQVTEAEYNQKRNELVRERDQLARKIKRN